MSDHDPPPDEPLSSAMRALLAPEREAGPAPGKARVRARIDASLFGGPPDGGDDGDGGDGDGGNGGSGAGGGAPGAGASTLPRLALARAAAIFSAGALAGGVLVAALAPPRVEIVERIVQAPSPSSSASEPVTARAPTITRPIDSAPESASASAPSSSSAPPGDTLAQERAILDTARTAIGRRDGASALEAVRRHEAKHPSGKLAEEREAIAVQALVLSGRQDDARARGAKFLTRWPDSVLVPTVRAAIGD